MTAAHPLQQDRPELLQQQQEVARLQGLLDASRKIHSTIRLLDVLDETLRLAAKELEADGAFFTPTAALGLSSRRTYGRVPESFPEAHGSRVELRDKHGHTLSSLVVARPSSPLSLEEEDFLEGIALQASVAIENARHHERLVAWERVQQDLASARLIQQSLLPKSLPQVPGYLVMYESTPCHEVGGDYIDIIPLSSECFVTVVADVAGKGLASALVSASFRSAFRAMVLSGLELTEIAARMNDLHYAEGEQARRKYVTAILGKLDARHHTLEVLNAGHNPGFLLGCGDDCLLESSGPPLGLFPGMRYASATYPLTRCCGVLFYTDGLTEAQCNDLEEFGPERLLHEFRSLQQHGCGAGLERLWTRVREFSGAFPQSDDMTAVALIRNSDLPV